MRYFLPTPFRGNYSAVVTVFERDDALFFVSAGLQSFRPGSTYSSRGLRVLSSTAGALADTTRFIEICEDKIEEVVQLLQRFPPFREHHPRDLPAVVDAAVMSPAPLIALPPLPPKTNHKIGVPKGILP